ncbi:MAG: hypothetical protein Q7K26_02145 [bacterium]|nr:hypothetical protein [bacterium]
MHRTDNHVQQIHCKNVAASFARHRASLVAEASSQCLDVKVDDGIFFVAEGFNACKQRVWLHAGPQGSPFVNGPSVTRRCGKTEYATLLLPKTE